MKIDINCLDLIVLDFDGVLTDNFVYIDQNGIESVKCSRSDGLAFDVLRKTNVKVIILSTETNKVVRERARKLKIEAYNSEANKASFLKQFCYQNSYDLDKVLYIGNDLNDFKAMQISGYSLCPLDSHPAISKIASGVIDAKGGNGVIRYLVEHILELDLLDIYKE